MKWWVCAVCVGLWGCEAELGTRVVEGLDGVTVVGVEGRKLQDGSWYALPLDWGGANRADWTWAICPGQSWRESFAMRNGTAEAVTVSLTLLDGSGEWRLMEAPLQTELPWQGPRVLPAGEVLVFDVLYAPLSHGLRENDLLIATWTSDGLEVREIHVAAWCGKEDGK